jgi:hypothetical protein
MTDWQEEAVVNYFQVATRHFPGGSEKTTCLRVCRFRGRDSINLHSEWELVSSDIRRRCIKARKHYVPVSTSASYSRDNRIEFILLPRHFHGGLQCQIR